MAKACRLCFLVSRWTFRLPCILEYRQEERRLRESADRHRVVVTGARGSGISVVSRMLCRGLQDPVDVVARASHQDMNVYSCRMGLGEEPFYISVVDKRCSVVTTPLSASLYMGHTAVWFLFDAGNVDTSLAETKKSIEALRVTVGDAKFDFMPKLLLCHKSDLLPVVGDTSHRVACMPPLCRELLERYHMSLVFTSADSQQSVDLAFGLVAEQWPQLEAQDIDTKEIPVVSAQDALRRTPWSNRTLRRPNIGPARTPPMTMLAELHSRVNRVD